MAHLLDLPSLRPGDRVQDPLLVRDVEEKPYAGGRFTILTLGNATGTIESAPVWDSDRAMVEGIRKRHVIQVIGQVGQYNGRRQLEIGSLRLLPEGSIDLTQLLPSIGDPAPYWEKLDSWRREIHSRKPRLAAVLALFYDDDDFRRRYERCPASVAGHHAALGDLLKHLVLAHHGRRELGSPVLPLTLEAEVLHWADNASAKTASMAEALRDADAFTEGLVSQKR